MEQHPRVINNTPRAVIYIPLGVIYDVYRTGITYVFNITQTIYQPFSRWLLLTDYSNKSDALNMSIFSKNIF